MKKTKKKAAVKQVDKFGPGATVAVEVPLWDGSVSMLTGRLVSKDKESIVLSSAAFVKNTGRRTQFFAGVPDSGCEIEVYADDVKIPAAGVFMYAWPHPLPTMQR